MPTKSKPRGKSISAAEVLDLTPRGLWLLVNDREFFLPYDDFPWFKGASVKDAFAVQLEHGTHLRWPTLDVDLEVESLDRLEQYPLIYR
jgi:hypothetical protein